MEGVDEAALTVLVDNRSVYDALVESYGLSILISVRQGGKTWRILFDVGGSAYALYANAKRLGVDLHSIDHVVISHMHRDHYYALVEAPTLLNPRRVYVPEPRGVSQRVAEILGELRVEKTVYIHGRVTIAPGVEAFGPVMSSGEISLLLRVKGVNVLLVACGHAGLDNILYWARVKPDVIVGGFHLKNAERSYVERLAGILKNARLVVGLHCTHWRDEMLSMLLGHRYISGGVGLEIVVNAESLLLRPPRVL